MSSLSSISPSTSTSSVSPASTISSLLSGSASSGSQPPVQAFGLVSGLNTQQIIQSLLAVDQAQVTGLQDQQQAINGQETAVKDIEAKLLALQNDIGQLSQPQNNVFANQGVTSSDPSLVTGAASTGATPGTYSLQVNSLAQAAEVASQGFSGPNALIPQGTIKFQVGSGPAATITVDNTNDTLQGLANAINNANIGLTATVINDGSGNQPYRLLLAATQTGAQNTINVTNNLAADGGGAASPVFNANYIGQVSLGSNYTGTSTPTANSGAGGYTGTTNDTYTFTVVNGGTVGTDNNIQLSYTNSSGTSKGTITLNSGSAGVLQSVAQGLQVQFSAGTLVAGQTLSVNTYTPTVQQAANASVTVGSGGGALTVQSPTNQINSLINGVTLQLQGSAPNQSVSITVAPNTDNIKTAIDNFVSDYNAVIQDIAQATSFDPSTKTAGPLLGNFEIEGILNQLGQIAGSVVQGAGSANSLAALGISFDSQGNLSVNDAQLTAALSGTNGASLNDIQALFSITGSSNNQGIQFVSGTSQTQASTTPYQVKITQAATQASVQAETALASSIVITANNDSLTLAIDGQNKTVTLAQGTYTPQGLAQAVQTAINGGQAANGAQATANVVGNNLQITSGSFGSTSQVQVISGSALSALGFKGGESTTGKDIQGSFIVNGVSEAAQGTGQFLLGDFNNAHTAGLQVRVNLTAAQVGSGTTASLTVNRGIASQLDQTLQNLTDPVSGRLTLITNGFDTSVQDLQSQINQQNQTIQTKQQSLVNEFAQMETTLSSLQTAGNYITQLQQTLLADASFSAGSSSGSKIA